MNDRTNQERKSKQDKKLCRKFKVMLLSQGISMEIFHGILLGSKNPKGTLQSFRDQFELFIRQESADENTAATASPYESDDDVSFKYEETRGGEPFSAKFVEEVLQSGWGGTNVFDCISERECYEKNTDLFPSSIKEIPTPRQDAVRSDSTAKDVGFYVQLPGTGKLSSQRLCQKSIADSISNDGVTTLDSERPQISAESKKCCRATAA